MNIFRSYFVFLLLAGASVSANIEPTVIINSAAMRDGTTLMDVSYRVNDPDDATVKTRALAFVDGVRSFANVLRPETFAEGTDANLGDTIATNTDHTLTWDVGADWDVDLGHVKFEVLAQDSRGLLEFDWITIPAVGEQPELSISLNSPDYPEVLDALFWQYASKDPGLQLNDGILTGSDQSGVFRDLPLVIPRSSSSSQFRNKGIEAYGNAYILRTMNLAPARVANIDYARDTARAGLSSSDNWRAENRNYDGTSTAFHWGNFAGNVHKFPVGMSDIVDISLSDTIGLILDSEGNVFQWYSSVYPPATTVHIASNAKAIATSDRHALILLEDGTVIGHGTSDDGALNIPDNLTDVVAISTSPRHSLAMTADGTVFAWGDNSRGETLVPPEAVNAIAIAADTYRSLAVLDDGSIITWGSSIPGGPPASASKIQSVSLSYGYVIGLKEDGTVVGWGSYSYGKSNIPADLDNVVKIASSRDYAMALKQDGTIVTWGEGIDDQPSYVENLSHISGIAAGERFYIAWREKSL